MTNQLDDVGFTTYAPTVMVEAGGCDTCGARAYLYAIVNDVELKYCGHHGSRYYDGENPIIIGFQPNPRK